VAWVTQTVYRRSRVVVVACGAVVFLVVAADCRTSGSTAKPSTTTVGGAAAASNPVSLRAGASYVALGSSFAAGPGIPQQSACGRSDHNYPNLVAARLHLTLTDVACSGATIANVLTDAQDGASPQIDAVRASDVLVTVTIGGNDLDYSAASIECAASAAQGRSCLRRLDRAAINAAATRLPSRLEAMLAAIKARAQHATVVVVTYPKVVPADAASCARLGLLSSDAAFIAAIGAKLEAAFRVAAQAAAVRIADPYTLSDGHGPCAGTSARWVEGAVPQSPGFPFHPNANGHEEMAGLVIAALRS